LRETKKVDVLVDKGINGRYYVILRIVGRKHEGKYSWQKHDTYEAAQSAGLDVALDFKK